MVRLETVAVVLALLLPCGAAAQSGEVAFYVVAHEDDWQLFFNPKPYDDVTRPVTKAVFVHVTAGDAGSGNGLFAFAREAGARRAIDFMADVRSPPGIWHSGTVSIRGHTIARFEYKNTVSYFMRLIDGRGDGAGFPGTGHASLERLRTGKINQLGTVDRSTTYLGWKDLVDTLEAVVRAEVLDTGALSVWLNIPDSSPAANPRDHSDHASVGLAMDTVASRLSCANVARFVGHGSSRMKENLSGENTAKQAGVYAVTLSAVGESKCELCASTWAHHRMWLGRNYFRTSHGDGSHCFDSRCSSCRGGRTCVDNRCACLNARSCPRGETWDDLACTCAN